MLFTAETFDSLYQQELARLRETWSDAARLAALCARTGKAQWCAQAKVAAKGAAADTLHRLRRKIAPDPTEEERQRTQRLNDEIKKRADEFNRRREQLRRGVKPTPEDIRRSQQLEDDWKELVSPRYLSGSKKGQRKKKFDLGAATAAATFM